jgi:hypothetical protein
MGSGHGVPKPNKAEHPNRKVSRSSYGPAATASITPEDEDRMSDAEWLRHMMRKHGPGPEGAR